jgi:hypothetical protein
VIWIGLALVGVGGFVVGPRVGFALAHAAPPTRATVLPWLAVVLFVVAWVLPSPTVSGSDTFTQHAVGGGAACALLGLFLAINLGVRSMALRIAFAYAVAAALGTAVEVVEFVADRLGQSQLSADSALDLVANSVGAIVAAIVLEVVARPGRVLDRPLPA